MEARWVDMRHPAQEWVTSGLTETSQDNMRHPAPEQGRRWSHRDMPGG
jgi:hypothetical protein